MSDEYLTASKNHQESSLVQHTQGVRHCTLLNNVAHDTMLGLQSAFPISVCLSTGNASLAADTINVAANSTTGRSSLPPFHYAALRHTCMLP